MNGTRVGYSRCSTDEQDVIIQTEQGRIYIDRGFSGTTRRNRNGLDRALAAVWDGSVFTVPTAVPGFLNPVAAHHCSITSNGRTAARCSHRLIGGPDTVRYGTGG
ncbi:recombinase family protein [Nonomuraea fuscirosea]|uniref:recombinase family protein n=1 Tax=Nonomuraea fuscirosea TaxID=1291556 RepID=UPI003430D613